MSNLIFSVRKGIIKRLSLRRLFEWKRVNSNGINLAGLFDNKSSYGRNYSQDRRPLIVVLAVLDALLFPLLLITFSIPAARITVLIMMVILTACIFFFRRPAQK